MITFRSARYEEHFHSFEGNWSLQKEHILTLHTLENIRLSKKIIARIHELKISHLTKIQCLSIPLQICGYDVFANAKTGSGKTLAFIIPMIEFGITVSWKKSNGPLGLIISPTRELTLQSYYVVKDLLKYQNFTFGVLMGGSNRKAEAEKLEGGLDILVATPGRLLDHLTGQDSFKINNLQFLVIDEADRCLEVGFEEEISEILKILPKNRQTGLFSATKSLALNNLGKISFKNLPVMINSESSRNRTKPNGIKHGFLVTELKNKLGCLVLIVKKNLKRKMIIFLSTCNEVDFLSLLFKRLGIENFALHGKMKQYERTSSYFSFCKVNQGLLISTDISARGLDFPKIDWIIQFSPPLDPREYVHRAGRSGRGLELGGVSLLFLLPSEIGFLKFLSEQKIILNEYVLSGKTFSNIEIKIKTIIERNKTLNELAIKSAKSYFSSYMNHSLKSIFCIKNINIKDLLIGYGIKKYESIINSFTYR